MEEYTYLDFLAATAERRCHEYTTLNGAGILPEQVELIVLGYLTINVGEEKESLMRIRSANLSNLIISEIDMSVALNLEHRSMIKNGAMCTGCDHIGPHLEISIDAKDAMDRKFTFTWDVERILEYFETDDISHLAEPIVDWFNIHVYITDEVANTYIRCLINDLFKIAGPMQCDWIDRIDWKILSQNPAAIQLLNGNHDNINWNIYSQNLAAIQLLNGNHDNINWDVLSHNTASIQLLNGN